MINTVCIKTPDPYHHQTKAFYYVKELDYFALFMEQGTGKSKVVLMKLMYLMSQKKVNSLLIICPNSIKDQWLYEEIPIHFDDPFTGIIWNGFNTTKSKKEFYNVLNEKGILKVFVINIEAFQSNKIDEHVKLFCNTTEPFIVVDESTRIKNPSAKRTEKITKGFQYRKYKCILTGTPTPNSPFDLYSQFNFLQNNYFKGMSYFHFKHRYGILLTETNRQSNKNYNTTLDETTFKKIKTFLNHNQPLNEHILIEASVKYKTSVKNITYINNLIDFYPYKNMDELNQSIEPVTFKIMKKDCLDLPDKIYEKLYAELNKDQIRIYKSLQKEFSATYYGKVLTVNDKMIMTMRLQMVTGGLFPYNELKIKQFIDVNGEKLERLSTKYPYEYIQNGCKLKVLLEDLEEVNHDTPIIVWCNFVGEIKLVTSELKEKGYKTQSFYGGTNKADRKNLINEFRKGKFQILVINPVVGGEGLNLQHVSLHYFYSNCYKADARLQAEDRSHRIGQTNKVLYKDIICKGTVDEKILQALKMKKSIIDYFRDSSLENIIY